jgi:hypothetical protein
MIEESQAALAHAWGVIQRCASSGAQGPYRAPSKPVPVSLFMRAMTAYMRMSNLYCYTSDGALTPRFNILALMPTSALCKVTEQHSSYKCQTKWLSKVYF